MGMEEPGLKAGAPPRSAALHGWARFEEAPTLTVGLEQGNDRITNIYMRVELLLNGVKW
jgi:hypothetical protein